MAQSRSIPWTCLRSHTPAWDHKLVASRVLASASTPLPAPGVQHKQSDGAPDEKEGRPKHQPPGYQACMMRGEMWPRRQETFPRPDASPPRCAQLMGLASRGCLVLVLGATAERRNLLFRSDLGLPWIRTLGLPRLSR